MLTVYMDCGADDRLLALTLADLVSGSVEGVVRNVVLIDRGMSADARSVAEHAGCRMIVPTELDASIASDRSEWFLWLEVGSRPMPGWTGEVVDYLDAAHRKSGSAMPARFRPAARDRLGFLDRVKTRRTALTDGLLIAKPQAIGLIRQRGPEPLSALAKGLATKRMEAELRPRRAAE